MRTTSLTTLITIAAIVVSATHRTGPYTPLGADYDATNPNPPIYKTYKIHLHLNYYATFQLLAFSPFSAAHRWSTSISDGASTNRGYQDPAIQPREPPQEPPSIKLLLSSLPPSYKQFANDTSTCAIGSQTVGSALTILPTSSVNLSISSPATELFSVKESVNTNLF